jgi:hypothetical protein
LGLYQILLSTTANNTQELRNRIETADMPQQAFRATVELQQQRFETGDGQAEMYQKHLFK